MVHIHAFLPIRDKLQLAKFLDARRWKLTKSAKSLPRKLAFNKLSVNIGLKTGQYVGVKRHQLRSDMTRAPIGALVISCGGC